MSTWFNLALLSEIADRGYFRQDDGTLPLFEAALYTGDGRPILGTHHHAAILSRALAPIRDLGMFRAPAPRLVLHISDPLAGDTFLALEGPLETEEEWAKATIERISDQLATIRPRTQNKFNEAFVSDS
jgi:hypothetical protein